MTVDDFKDEYPDFSQSFIDKQISSKLRVANVLIDRIGNFGDMRYEALHLLVAHLLALDKLAGKHGTSIQTKTSKKVGDVSFNYATAQGSDEWYGLSNFGQQLLFLINIQPKAFAGFVV